MRKLLLLGCLLALFGCQPTSTPMELYTALDKHCPEGNCQVDLGEVVDGDWTQVIFVKRMTPVTALAEVVETEGLAIGEFDEAILFAKGRSVERVEKRTYHPEQPYKGTVFLTFPPGSGSWVSYKRQEAVFDMQVSVGDDYRNMELVGR